MTQQRGRIAVAGVALLSITTVGMFALLSSDGPAPSLAADDRAAPASDPTSPEYWPLIVPVGPDGMAARPDEERSGAMEHGWLGAVPKVETAVFRPGQQPDIVLARGPVKLGSSGPGWHNIGPTGGGTAGYGAGPRGGKAQSGGGGVSIWNGDGSFDYTDDSGHVHLNGPDDGGGSTGYIEDKDGNRTSFEFGDDGSRTYWGPDGSVRIDSPDGSSSTYNRDGSITNTAPDGSTTIDLDPPPLPPAAPGPKGGAQGIGEPHFLTDDGTGFSTQAVGEFTLAEGVEGQALQMRTAPYRDSRAVSAITGMTAQAGGATIQILLDGSVLIDGAPAPEAGSALRHELPQGGAVGIWRDAGDLAHVVVIWPDLSTLWVTRRNGFMDFAIQWRNADPARMGLLGQQDGDPANDLTSRSGAVADAADPVAVAAFVDSWRVTDEGSLFSYAADESTETFTDRGFPYETPDTPHQDQAEKLCAGLTPVFLRDACIFDVSVTGNEEFATSATAAAEFAARNAAEHVAEPVAKVEFDGACASPDDDPAKAEPLQGDTVEITTTATTSRVFRLETTRGIVIQTRIGTAHSGDYSADAAGYCVFDGTGRTVIPLTNSGTDSFFSRDDTANLPEGVYFLKITGPGETRLSIILNHPGE